MAYPLPASHDDEAAQAALLSELRRRQGAHTQVVAPAPGRWRPEIGGPSRRQLAASTRQLATLIGANVPLVRALDLVSSQAGHRRLKAELEDVTTRVRDGESLAQSLSASPDTFSRLYINLVQVGEHAGLLAEVLTRLAVHLEQTDALRRKIQNALMYPAIILLVAVGSTLVLLLKVIPLFAEMFQQANVPLPAPTQLVIQASVFVQLYWLWLIGFSVIGVFVFRSMLAHPGGRLFFDHTQLIIPLMGTLVHKGALARFTHSLGTLLASGVPLLQALSATQETLSNRYLEQAIRKAIEAVGQGESLAASLQDVPGWPPLVPHLIEVGEESGELAPVLEHLAEYYTIETEHLVQTLTAVLEPLLIVLVALLIGGLLVAMYLPIFNLNEVVS